MDACQCFETVRIRVRSLVWSYDKIISRSSGYLEVSSVSMCLRGSEEAYNIKNSMCGLFRFGLSHAMSVFRVVGLKLVGGEFHIVGVFRVVRFTGFVNVCCVVRA
jgi:hypothetical protein